MANTIDFSKRNKNNVLDALDGKKSYKKLTSAEWHQYVQNYNYDDGIEPFMWLIKQSSFDKGTALCLYWHLSPTFFAEKTLDEGDFQYNVFSLVREIEQNFLNGFYESEQFSFDPYIGFVSDSKDVSKIPPIMLQKTNGIAFERLDVESAFLRLPNEKERSTIDKRIKSAIKILQTVDSQFEHENIDKTVNAIKNTIDHFLEHDAEKTNLKHLSFLWLDCVAQKYGWEFNIWDYETGVNYGVSNKSKNMFCPADTLIRHTISGVKATQTIIQLYQDLNGVCAPIEISNKSYFGKALIFATGHLKFQER